MTVSGPEMRGWRIASHVRGLVYAARPFEFPINKETMKSNIMLNP